MELEFDKEIDALLREDRGRTITISEFTAPHIDADELAAFAENALPGVARKGYIAHLADCNKCRKVLSGFIALQTEAEPDSAISAAVSFPGKQDTPWHRRLFSLSGLAYAMGGLVLLFSGFMAYTILQNAYVGDIAMSPTVTNTSAEENASSADEVFVSTIETDANTAKTVNGNGTQISGIVEKPIGPSATNTVPHVPTATGTPEPVSRPDVLDMAREEAPPPPPPALAAPARPVQTEDDRTDEKAKTALKAAEDKQVLSQQRMPSGENTANTAVTGPSRAARDRYDATEAKKRTAESAVGAASSTPARTVSGKTFTKRDGIWYDAAYTNQPTTDIRRNTNAYKKLDRGLRTIAENLDGTVIVVWNSKAYRIQ